jgi:hypothetical protein
MVTKRLAKSLYKDLYTSVNGKYPRGCGSKDTDACIPDTAYNFFFSPRPNVWVPSNDPPAPVVYTIGFTFVSPDEPSHHGLVYQDRSTQRKDSLEQKSMKVDGSALLSMQQMKNLTCFKIRPTGNLGKLMFSYAFLIGICSRNNVAPFHCASLSIHNSNNIDRIVGTTPVEQFVQTFKIALPPCPIQGAFFHDHKNQTAPNSIRYRSEAVKQPSGTTFMGYFLSYKYFSTPDAKEAGFTLETKHITVDCYFLHI